MAAKSKNIFSGYYQSKVFPVQLPRNMNLIQAFAVPSGYVKINLLYINPWSVEH